MNENSAQIARILAREYIFHSLTPEQLLALADQFETLEFKENQSFELHDQPKKKFYIIYDGKLQVKILQRGGKSHVTILQSGDYFGEEALLSGESPRKTIKALEQTRLVTLDQEQFKQFLEQYPTIRSVLLITMESRRMARSPRFSWINSDESVYFIGRKHYIFLIRSLILPILFIVGSIPLLTIGVANSRVALLLGLGLLFFGFLGFIWNWLDWGNDYYIITQQRVVWIEKILLLYDSRDEAPLYNILAVDVYSSFFGQILDYGDVSARTFTGRIYMQRANQPWVLASYLEGLRKRSEQITRELEEKEMQAAIARGLERHKAAAPVEVIPNIPPPLPFKPVKKKAEPKQKSKGLGARLQNFLKVRYEQDGTITYRKAWPLLVWKIWLPSLLLLFWSVGMVFLVSQGNTGGTLLFWWVIMIGFLLGLLFWLWYNYTDWKNDIYRLTPTQIFDIEKKPLGSELKKSADLENILTITHTRNFLGILLKFGDVIITVGETQFFFFSVYNPDRVHQDIANFQENLRQRKKRLEEARERERMVNWLVAYHSESDN